MRLILVDRGREFCEVLRGQFRSHPEVEVVCGRFEELPAFDCVVTAGNSFGLMDAGMDLAVVRHFGRHVMDRIQKQILDDHLGEQPVGTHWGAGTFTGVARPGKTLLGVSFELAGDNPGDKVPPQGIRDQDGYYGR